MKTNLRNMLFLAGVTLILSNPCVLAHTDVTAEQARDLIDSTPDLIVVDVREPSEYCDATGHIPGALNYPWNSGELEARYEELPMHSPILVVCRSGGRSNRAARFLDSKGFAMVYDMMGGMRAWIWETAPCKYAGGSGTSADPYKIATAGDLMLLGKSPEDYDKNFILTADIDLDPNLPGRKVFDKAVIAPDVNDAEHWFQGSPFTGTFDGDNHTISHLTIVGKDYLGLFGQLWFGAVVKNLGVVDVNVTGSGNSAGGLVGFNLDASITTSYSTGTVTGNEDVGGLVGYNWFGSITTSYSTGTVSAYSYVGGLVGNNGGSIITSCSTGTVTGNSSVGGLVGWNTSSITSSYSTGMVTGDDYVGGLVGWNYGAISTSYSTGSVSGTGLSVGGLVGFNRRHSRRGSITSSYSTGMVTGNEDVGGLVGSNSGGSINSSYSTGMVSGETGVGGLVGLNWFGSISTSYSTGSVSGNSDVGGLVGYSDYGIIITSFWDIESSGQATSASGTGLTTAEMQDPNTFMDAGWDFVGKPDGPHDIWAESEGGGYPILCWQLPQGFGLPTFSGGTGEADDPYRISTPSELNGIGHNPRLMDAYFELVNDIDLAGIDFYIIGSEFYPFTGSFNGNGHTISHMTIVGNDSLGLFGYLESGAEVKNLGVVDVNVTGSYYCGGLVGFNSGGTIANCYSTGTVSGDIAVGGLVGVNSGSITTSYSAGTVSGNSSVGGLVGSNWGSITSSYSTGMVTGDDYVGGLVGFNFIGSSITTCYSTGEVSATSWEVGGLVGDSMSRAEVHNSFWDIETSGQTSSAGGTGKTTAEMQTASTFLDAGWDFLAETENGIEDIWWILEGQDYPRLWWELTEADFIVVDDFESYNDLCSEECNYIFYTWTDGYGDPNNGSLVGHENPPFAEQIIVHSGKQSMPLFYDNSGTANYSETTANTTANMNNLVIDRDWTIEGVGVLSLWFYGDAANAPEPMYVALNRNAVVYYENPDALLIENWTEWRIELQEFAAQGVDLTNVNTISIGFGDKNNPQPGGSGLVFFDDIRLYQLAPEPEQ